MVVKALMEKKAKEMEGTIAEINQANKETQMKLNSCEFNLQIKEHEASISNSHTHICTCTIAHYGIRIKTQYFNRAKLTGVIRLSSRQMCNDSAKKIVKFSFESVIFCFSKLRTTS